MKHYKAWLCAQYGVKWSPGPPKKLKITAKDPKTDIYLSDETGALVQHEKGVMDTSVIGGTYYVEFGLHSPSKQEIVLLEDMEIESMQARLQDPKLKLPRGKRGIDKRKRAS